MYYVALIHKEKTSDYGVSFPDFPGCISAGKTLEEAQMMAQEAINNHREMLREIGEAVPAPSSLDEIMADKENQNAVAVLVRIPSHKTVRINVTFPEDVLEIIDRRANHYHLSRSAFLAEAAMKFGKSGESEFRPNV
ncbi:MAG: hypothetical protein K0R76_1252 [Alphaproteobacteria bacterium]|jgi:predicted RNase H-like HicB family nuclease|nr:hypothetical protein [Alphaproteobacteria bacterium]